MLMERTPGPADRLTPSLLDRLFDLDDAGSGAARRPFQSISELRGAVRRDLENLLNTRWRCVRQAEIGDGLASSLVNYGLPDFCGGNLQAAQDPEVVFQQIIDAIERFEPRLKKVRVVPLQDEPSVDRTLRFQIEAVLHVEPWHEQVRFTTVLEPATGKVQVKGANKP
jgi:type VI secretion system protein ImpF